MDRGITIQTEQGIHRKCEETENGIHLNSIADEFSRIASYGRDIETLVTKQIGRVHGMTVPVAQDTNSKPSTSSFVGTMEVLASSIESSFRTIAEEIELL